MIHEYAISPEICTDWQELRFLIQSFGKEEGRLFSDVPKKKWYRLAIEAIRSAGKPPLESKRLAEGVRKLIKKSLYKRNIVPNIDTEKWIDISIAVHHDRPFRAILTDAYDGSEKFVLINDHQLIDQELWKTPIDLPVERSAEKMVEAIKPMLDCANEVILIDRNFKPWEIRFRNFLIEMLKHLSSRTFSPSIQKISYNVGDRISKEHLEHECQRKIVPDIPGNMTVNFFIWPKDELHDRYILTNNGGVKFGAGLDEYDGTGPREVEISRISNETLNKWWSACKRRNPTFTIS